jgi:hypothetical protein
VSLWFSDGRILQLWRRSPPADSLLPAVGGLSYLRHLAYDEVRRHVVATTFDRKFNEGEAEVATVSLSGEVTQATGIGRFEQVEAIAARDGRLAVVGERVEDGDLQLYLFDDLGRRPLGRARFGSQVESLYAAAMDGPAVYVAGAGLSVMDISDVAQPRLAQHWPMTNSYMVDMDIAGNLLAVSEGEVMLFDITDRLSVRPLARWPSPTREDGVAILGRFLLVAAGDLGLLVLPIHEPAWEPADTAFLPLASSGP